MITLKNTKPLPNNAQWSYLFCIADVYARFSSSSYRKMYDLLCPHPLKDYEVIQILETQYNLKGVHRNTISNTRKYLENYFGFIFKTNKKGKYLVNNSHHNSNPEIDEALIAAAFSLTNLRAFNTYETRKIIKNLSFLTSDETVRDAILATQSNYLVGPRDNCSEKISVLLKAMAKNKFVSLIHLYRGPETVKPIKLYINKNNDLTVCVESKFNVRSYFSLSEIESINLQK